MINPANSVQKIKEYLLMGKPIGVGVQTFRTAWVESQYAEHKGEIQMPLTRVDSNGVYILDEASGGHAITIVGYRDNDLSSTSIRPGGGYFIFKNSWGQQWARANVEVAAGYGQIPYAYIERYCIAAVAIDDLIWSDGHTTV